MCLNPIRESFADREKPPSHSGDKTASSLLRLPASVSVDLDDSHNNAEADETFILLAADSGFLRQSQNTETRYLHKTHT